MATSKSSRGLITNEFIKRAILAVQSRRYQETEVSNVFRPDVIDPNILMNIRLHLGSLKTDLLRNVLLGEANNIFTFEVMVNILRSLLYSPPIMTGILTSPQRIRSYIGDLSMMRDYGDSYLFHASLGDTKEMIAIKAPRLAKTDRLMHEALIMREGTNSLRATIPNFQYMYAQFSASPPYVDADTKKVISWCTHTSTEVNYLLLERISTVTMDDFLTKCTPRQFLSLYMQIIYAVRYAHSHCKFTDYNLLAENIFLRELSQECQIPYITEQGEEYLTTNILGIITNFSRAHMEKNGMKYGFNGGTKFFVSAQHDFILSDAYQLLLSSLAKVTQSQNDKVAEIIKRMYRYFNDDKNDDIINILETQRKYKFRLPRTKTTLNLKLDDFLQFVRQITNTSFLGPRDQAISLYKCFRKENDLPERLGITPTSPLSARTFFNYYDTVTLLRNSGQGEMAQRFRNSFDYGAARPHFIAYYRTMINQINELLNFPIVVTSRFSSAELLTESTMHKIRMMYTRVVNIYDDKKTLQAMEEVGKLVGRDFNFTEVQASSGVATLPTQETIPNPTGGATVIYGDQKLIDEIVGARANFEEALKPRIEEINRAMKINNKVLDTLIQTLEYRRAAVQNPHLKWYGEERLNFSFAHETTVTSITRPTPVDFIQNPNSDLTDIVKSDVIPIGVITIMDDRKIQSPAVQQTTTFSTAPSPVVNIQGVPAVEPKFFPGIETITINPSQQMNVPVPVPMTGTTIYGIPTISTTGVSTTPQIPTGEPTGNPVFFTIPRT